MDLYEILEDIPKDEIIGNNLITAYSKINNSLYKKIICTVSGGYDSDIVMDICTKCDKDKKIEYVWFDTGLEYQATKDHLRELEQKYNVQIQTRKATKPIPVACKEEGGGHFYQRRYLKILSGCKNMVLSGKIRRSTNCTKNTHDVNRLLSGGVMNGERVVNSIYRGTST